MSAPDERPLYVAPHDPNHPAWCNRRHAPRAAHSADIATEPVEYTAINVSLYRWGRDVILLDLRETFVDPEGVEFVDATEQQAGLTLSADAARRLARRLIEAADMLEGGVQ